MCKGGATIAMCRQYTVLPDGSIADRAIVYFQDDGVTCQGFVRKAEGCVPNCWGVTWPSGFHAGPPPGDDAVVAQVRMTTPVTLTPDGAARAVDFLSAAADEFHAQWQRATSSGQRQTAGDLARLAEDLSLSFATHAQSSSLWPQLQRDAVRLVRTDAPRRL